MLKRRRDGELVRERSGRLMDAENRKAGIAAADEIEADTLDDMMKLRAQVPLGFIMKTRQHEALVLNRVGRDSQDTRLRSSLVSDRSSTSLWRVFIMNPAPLGFGDPRFWGVVGPELHHIRESGG